MITEIVKSNSPDVNDVLVIKIELQTPTPSSTGKTLVVASTHGNVVTTAMVNGKPVKLGLNAFIAR